MAVASGIGPIGNLEGRIIGLNAVGNLASDVGPLVAERYLRRRAAVKKAAKDFNDQPVSSTVGVDKGKPVKDVSWMPAW